jgi:hypothetical protein
VSSPLLCDHHTFPHALEEEKKKKSEQKQNQLKTDSKAIETANKTLCYSVVITATSSIQLEKTTKKKKKKKKKKNHAVQDASRSLTSPLCVNQRAADASLEAVKMQSPSRL